MTTITRRTMLKTAAATALSAQWLTRRALAQAGSPFRIAVINDEISQDFDHVCHVAVNEFGMRWVELRTMWNKNILDLSDAQLAETEKILARYKLTVTDIASALFKTDWPGAPRSTYSSAADLHGAAANTFKEQDAVLEKGIQLARRFQCNKLRGFDFWRLDDQAPYRKAIDEKLRDAAEKAGKQGVLLVLENEYACNTATGREAARTMNAIRTSHLALNWDPGNAVMRGELDAFPTAWEMLPKDRIHHCHCKNAVKGADGKIVWSPVDKGYIDWTAQFRALKAAGYREAVSLETHWAGAPTPEESTRISWAGMKKALEDSGTL